MSDPTLYWYPAGAIVARSLSLGARVSDLQVSDRRDRQTVAPLGSVPVHHDLGGTRQVTITVERRVTSSLIRELRTLCNFLQAGGYVAFCLDPSKLWGGWCRTTLPAAGDTTLLVDTGHVFGAYASGTLVNGDEITIESPNPEYRREWAVVNSASSMSINVSPTVIQDYDTGPVFVRYADFYPALYIDPKSLESSIPISDRRLSWTWSIVATEHPAVIEALAEQAETLLATDHPQAGDTGTIESALSAAHKIGRFTTGQSEHKGTRAMLLGRW